MAATGHGALDGLHGIIQVQPAPIERLPRDVGFVHDLAEAQTDDPQRQHAGQFARAALGQIGREVLQRGSRPGRPLLGDVPGAGVGCEKVQRAAEHDGPHTGLGGSQQEMVGAAGGVVKAVEVAGRVGGSNRSEVDDSSGVSGGLCGKGRIAQIADEMFLGRGAGREGNGIHGADLMSALPMGSEHLPQPPGAAGNRDTHLSSPPSQGERRRVFPIVGHTVAVPGGRASPPGPLSIAER